MSALVSVIVTTFNRSTFLEKSLSSIVNQTYSNLELIVVDDGSEASIASENKAICEALDKCTYYYKANTGQPDSRNYGIARSKGEYIGFNDDDDYWEKDKLEKQFQVFNDNPECQIVTGCIEYIKDNGEKTGDLRCHEGHNDGYIFQSLLLKNRTASITPLFKRTIFDKVGLFNPNFTIGEDWEFWRRVSYYFKFYHVNDVLAYVRLHPENMSKHRSGQGYENFHLYRKLTKALLKWGRQRFSQEDRRLIAKTEWVVYRKIFVNKFPGILKKIQFLAKITANNVSDGLHVAGLILKNEVLKAK